MLKTIEQKVLKLIDENHLIHKNDRILIALSGGADSVFLFHFFLKFKRRLGIQFSAFHLNHKIERCHLPIPTHRALRQSVDQEHDRVLADLRRRRSSSIPLRRP